MIHRIGRSRSTINLLAQLVSHIATRAILLAATVVVARSVGVAAYGLFALGIVFYQGGVLLRDAGLGQASIIVGARGVGVIWQAFVASTVLGALLAAAIAWLSDPIATLLGLPEAAPFIRILALAFGVGSFGIASNAALERNLRFTRRAAVEVSSYVVLAAVTVAGLVAGLGAEALAWGYVAQGLVQAGLALAAEPPWVHRASGTAGFRSLVRYGGLLWATALMTYVAVNVDNVVVAALGGAAAIGVYALSWTLGTMIAISLAQVLNRVALPYYARATDVVARRLTFAAVVPLSAALATFAAIPVIVLSPEIANLVFDTSAAIAPLAILAAYGVARAAGMAVGTALNGSGEARSVTLASALNVALIGVLVVPGYRWAGPSGVAAVVAAAQVLTLAFVAPATRRAGASLAFLAAPALAVAGLVLLVAGPAGPMPLPVRLLVGSAGSVLAGAWVWRIARGRLNALG